MQPFKQPEEKPTITDFPGEVLEVIFNHLSPVDRRMARQVCREWRQILWANRYLTTATLLVSPETLNNEQTLNHMQRWAFPEIKLTTYSWEGESFDGLFHFRVKMLLRSNRLLNSLQKIALETNGRDLHFLLEPRNSGYTFYNVTELILIAKPSINSYERFIPLNVHVRMPSLRILRMDSITRGSYQFLRLFSHQLHTFVIQVHRKQELLMALGLQNWENLKELAIGVCRDRFIIPGMLSLDDFSVSHFETLSGLQKLEIKDGINLFAKVYALVISSAPNLTHLRVTGVEVNPNVLQAANTLPNLQFLQLLGRSSNPNWSSEILLDLPELRTLHLSPELMARPGNLPKLHTLAVINHTDEAFHWRRMWGLNALEMFVGLPTIRKVHIRGLRILCPDAQILTLFNDSCTVLVQDRDDYIIGTIGIPADESPQQFRVQWEGDIEQLPKVFESSRKLTRGPCSRHCVSHDECLLEVSSLSLLSNRSSISNRRRKPGLFQRRMQAIRKQIQHDLAVVMRRIQRIVFILGTMGCCCGWYSRYDD